VSGLATANNAALITSNTGVPSLLAESATAGVPLVSGGTGVPPAWTTATVPGGGTGVTSTTAYAVITGGTTSTGALQSVASVGTSGQVLTSNGAGALPTFQSAAAGGTLVYISSQTAAASASLNFTTGISSTYNTYLFVLDGLRPATDQVTLRMRTSTNAGGAWDSGASDYSYAAAYFTGVVGVNASGGAAQIILSNSDAASNDIGNAAGEGISGNVYLYNPSDTSNYKRIKSEVTWTNAGGGAVGGTGNSQRNSTADIDGVQFYFSSGNITSGSVHMYGIKSS
jgi:hypothetical protein